MYKNRKTRGLHLLDLCYSIPSDKHKIQRFLKTLQPLFFAFALGRTWFVAQKSNSDQRPHLCNRFNVKNICKQIVELLINE